MKEAIEKAIGRGLFKNEWITEVNVVKVEQDSVWLNPIIANIHTAVNPPFVILRKKGDRSEGNYFYTFNDLIFDTPFIDKLVGEECDQCGDDDICMCEAYGTGEQCGKASHHRSNLANMSNEERVSYINKLAGVEG